MEWPLPSPHGHAGGRQWGNSSWAAPRPNRRPTLPGHFTCPTQLKPPPGQHSLSVLPFRLGPRSVTLGITSVTLLVAYSLLGDGSPAGGRPLAPRPRFRRAGPSPGQSSPTRLLSASERASAPVSSLSAAAAGRTVTRGEGRPVISGVAGVLVCDLGGVFLVGFEFASIQANCPCTILDHKYA
jgi:hypothetical protein